jgi:PAS domain S-box-containing protein
MRVQSGVLAPEPMQKPPPRPLQTAPYLGMLAVAACVFVAGAYAYYRAETAAIVRERYENIEAIGQLKAQQIQDWREHLLDHARAAARNLRALDTVTTGAHLDSADPERARRWLSLASRSNGDEATLLFSGAGDLLAAEGAAPSAPDAATRAALVEAGRTGSAVLSSLFRAQDGRVHIDAVAPTRAADGTIVAWVAHRGSAETTLFPLLQTWPTPSPSAETLLVTADGDDVLFLNELRHRPGTALRLLQPRSSGSLPAARAVAGERGEFAGVDYRGVEVLADLRPVDGSPWFLVSKVDRSEILKDARRRALTISGVALLLLGFVAALGAQAVRRRQAAFYQQLYESERERRLGQERFRATLYSIGDAVLTAGIDGRVREMNRAAESLSGWDEQAARGRPLDEVFQIVDEVTRQRLEGPVATVLRAGEPVEIAGRSLLIARDGTERPIADSAAPIRDEAGEVTGVVLVFSDQTARRAARRRLEESEERLRLAVGAANQGLYDANVQTGEVEVTPEYAALLGHEPTTFRETHEAWLERLHPDDRQTAEQNYRDYLEGRSAEYNDEFRQRAADGQWKWFQSTGKLMERTADGLPLRLLGTLADITGRKLAEARIQRLAQLYTTLSHCDSAIVRSTSEEQLLPRVCRAAVVHGGMAMAWVGLVEPDTRRVRPVANYGDEHGYVNGLEISVDASVPTGRGPTGTAIREGRPFWCANFATDPATAPWHERGIRSGWGSSAALPLFRGGHTIGALTLYAGTVDAFDEEARSLLVAMAADISFALDSYAREEARHRAEEDTRAARAQLEATVDAVPDLMFEVGLDGHLYDYRSPRTELLAVPSSVFLGRTVREVLPEVPANAIMGAIAEADTKGWSTGATYELDTPAGHRWFEISMALKRAHPGPSPRFIMLARDVTERKLAEEHRERLEAQLRQSQKMEAIGQLAGGVAHDFNNLLTIINGRADLALSQVPPGHPLREDLAEVRQAGERAASLTRQLLAFGRRQMVHPQPLSLTATVAGLRGMLRRLISEDIRLDVELTVEDCGVRADPGQLEQVLLNLVINARDATPQGGSIVIDVRNVELDRDAAASLPPLSPGRYARLTVRDSGTGMDETTRARIFEPFFTTKGPGHGTGLGLSTTYNVVTQCGGAIAVDSAPGGGSTFSVYLPREATPSPSTSGETTPARSRGIETVLVVDDERALVGMASRILTRAGYTVLVAPDGDEALRILDSHDRGVDLLFTDVVIPGMSGRELAERVVARSPATKVLYCSGYTDDAVLLHGVESNQAHFIGKPYSGGDLTRKVRELLDGV